MKRLRWGMMVVTGLLFAAFSPLHAQVPPEIATGSSPTDAQTWSGTIQSWPSEPTASGYRLYRGAQADLPNLLGSGTDSCIWYWGYETSIDLALDDPSTNEGKFCWYLVTAYNIDGEGSAGNATDGARMVNATGGCRCGDLICDPGEEGSCPDCPYCGDLICDPGEQGTCTDCPPQCGDGFCDPTEQGWCADCPPLCGDGWCEPGEQGWCADCPPLCGDGFCEQLEIGMCPADCPMICGDGLCEPEEMGWCPDCP